MSQPTRIEHDSLGPLAVPAAARYGAQTQRAVQNFPISGLRMPPGFIAALARIKQAAAVCHADLGLLDGARAAAIAEAAEEVVGGRWQAEFPVDVFQTGSGTSSNMNVNEVVAHRASELSGLAVHPNDHVNLGQSSNDAVPTAIQIAVSLALRDQLGPALRGLAERIGERAVQLDGVIKTGRTHLMDAMPIRFGQELRAWQAQLMAIDQRLAETALRLQALPLGGTAIGTGINAHPEYATRVCNQLHTLTGLAFRPADNLFVGIAGQDTSLELAAQLNALAVVLSKICNDLRWMNSGPLAGLGEIELPALQPGSSIMPGKVNPVIPEAVLMLAAHVMGSHATITVAAASGNFQLNVMLPLVAHHLLTCCEWLGQGMQVLADKAIAGFTVREDRLQAALQRNPILVTALNPLIGYERAAQIAKRAYAEGRPVIELAIEDSGLSEEVLRAALDPARLTSGGLVGGGAMG